MMSQASLELHRRRRTANMTERLAAAYLALKLVPEPLASSGNAKEIVAYVEADHNILHCLGGDTRPQNLNLLPQPLHREKSRRDTSIAAKVKRIADAHAEFRRALLAKAEGLQIKAPRLTRKGNPPLPCGRHSGWKKTARKMQCVEEGAMKFAREMKAKAIELGFENVVIEHRSVHPMLSATIQGRPVRYFLRRHTG